VAEQITYNFELKGVQDAGVCVQAWLVPVDRSQVLEVDGVPLSRSRIVTIGRQVGAYMLIDHGSVSRRHAEVSYAQGHYALRDVGSFNSTFVNDTRLAPGDVYMLKPNDRLRFGIVDYTLQMHAAARQQIAARPAAVTRLLRSAAPGDK